MAKLNGPALLKQTMGETTAACMRRRRVHLVMVDSSRIFCVFASQR
jgi:hypothetical protein